MNKSELVKEVASTAGLTLKEAAAAVEATIAAIAASDKTTLVGFGTFAKKTSKARTGRNPQTGAAIEIPAKTKLTFSASKTAGK